MNYRRLEYCSRCEQMTNHWYTEKEGLYTVECCKCGHRPIQAEETQGSAVWAGLEIKLEVDEDDEGVDGSRP